MKLGLGTVQFGLNYGISNEKGVTPLQEVKKLLDYAKFQGIGYLDTAPLYGSSEEILGALLEGDTDFKIITKTPKPISNNITNNDVIAFVETFNLSLQKLRQKNIYGVLFHDSQSLLRPGGLKLYEAAIDLKGQDLVKKIGVSVYSSDEIEVVIRNYNIDIIQVPVNVLDQRMVISDSMQKLKRLGVEIHSRSVFLQGLLLMEPGSLHPYFKGIKKHLQNYHEEISRVGLTPVQAAIQYIKTVEDIDVAVVGVNNTLQLKEIIEAYKKPLASFDYSPFALADEKMLHPSLWEIK